jgi:hypothetical protein
MSDLVPQRIDQLEGVERQSGDRNPAAVYLAGLRAGRRRLWPCLCPPHPCPAPVLPG